MPTQGRLTAGSRGKAQQIQHLRSSAHEAVGFAWSARSWHVHAKVVHGEPSPSMQIVNDVTRRGFVVGWDPLKLGNALSCLATMFVLSRRTGLACVYPYADNYTDLFGDAKPLSRIHVPRHVDKAALDRLLTKLKSTLDSLPTMNVIAGSTFAELGQATVKRVVWFTKHEGVLGDWCDGDAERHAAAFGRRGNGIILQGSYWRQYTDMRQLAKEGEALRRHLGPLRDVGLASPIDASDDGTYRIGLFLRLGDYKIWLNGRFYFALETYRALALRLHAELGDRPHVFHIFSDRSFPPEVFADLPVMVATDNIFDDFIRLSRCDLVVGPPSTFSTWATFLGRRKRLVMTADCMDQRGSLIDTATEIDFPTGAYLPGDAQAKPI